jgi:hypothetical protein
LLLVYATTQAQLCLLSLLQLLAVLERLMHAAVAALCARPPRNLTAKKCSSVFGETDAIDKVGARKTMHATGTLQNPNCQKGGGEGGRRGGTASAATYSKTDRHEAGDYSQCTTLPHAFASTLQIGLGDILKL